MIKAKGRKCVMSIFTLFVVNNVSISSDSVEDLLSMILIRLMFIFFSIILFLSKKDRKSSMLTFFKLNFHIICIKKAFFDNGKSSTFYKKVFYSAGR